MGRLPVFVVIGAMKSGTTSFASYLDRHPEIVVSKPKEPNFFADPGNWERGLDWYMTLFDIEAPIVGEASTHYTKSPEHVGAPERIRRIIPDVRLLYLVRDPIERMRSMFVHRADKHQEPGRSLAEAIDQDPSYIEISRYGRQLEPYLDLFDGEQILVLTTDELRADPDALLARSFRHIGADSTVQVATNEVFYSGAGKRYLNDFGFTLASVLQRKGIRNWVPPTVRRTVKHWLSSKITEEVLHLEESTEREIRDSLAADMLVIRRMVGSSGAEVPAWLQDSVRSE